MGGDIIYTSDRLLDEKKYWPDTLTPQQMKDATFRFHAARETITSVEGQDTVERIANGAYEGAMERRGKLENAIKDFVQMRKKGEKLTAADVEKELKERGISLTPITVEAVMKKVDSDFAGIWKHSFIEIANDIVIKVNLQAAVDLKDIRDGAKRLSKNPAEVAKPPQKKTMRTPV